MSPYSSPHFRVLAKNGRSFCQDRMTCIPEEFKVLYRSKDGGKENVFDAPEWLAAMCAHVPNKGEQMVWYCGYYNNVSRAIGKTKIRMNGCPASWNKTNHQKITEKTGPE